MAGNPLTHNMDLSALTGGATAPVVQNDPAAIVPAPAPAKAPVNLTGMDLTAIGVPNPGAPAAPPPPAPAPGPAGAADPTEPDPTIENGFIASSSAGRPAGPPVQAPPPKKLANVSLYPDEFNWAQEQAARAMGEERYHTSEEQRITNEANQQAAQQAAQAVGEHEARAREIQNKELARQDAIKQKVQKVEQIQKWGEINNTFATFFDGQRRLNAGILAAGLYRAGKPEHALRTLEQAMAHEYDGQKMAIQRAQAEGQEAANSLNQYRKMFQDEKEADLMWEAEMTRLVANKMKAAYATAKTGAEREAMAANIARMDQKHALIQDGWARQYLITDNPAMLERNLAVQGRPGANLSRPLQGPQDAPGQPFGSSMGGNSPQVQGRGVGPAGGPGGPVASYPRLDAARAGVARVKAASNPTEEGYPTSPSGGPVAGLSPTERARQMRRGNPVVAEEGWGTPTYDNWQRIFKDPEHSGFEQSTQGGWAPKNMDTIRYNGTVRLVPKGEASTAVNKASAQFIQDDVQGSTLKNALAELRAAQKKYGITGEPSYKALMNTLDKPERDALENAYRRANTAITAVASGWWRNEVDNSVIKEEERKRLESMIPSLSSGQGMYLQKAQLGDIDFLNRLTEDTKSRNAERLDRIVEMHGGLPANVSRITVTGRQRDPQTGKETGDRDFVSDPRGRYIQYVPGTWGGKGGVDTRSIKR